MPVMRLLLWLLGWTGVAVCAAEWQPVTWNGEPALVSTSQGVKAIVSLERSRLMYFGPAERDANLLLAPPTRENRNVLGGHRLWLGPQSTWTAGFWPPPAAWEYSAPESQTVADGRLRLLMPDAGHGWPRLTRTYHWVGASLVCGAELHGGTRAAQAIHILQVPSIMVVSVLAQPDGGHPQGYVLLPSSAGPFAADFTPPPHVSRTGHALRLTQHDTVGKLGFRPQFLAGSTGRLSLRVDRGAVSGEVAGEPDQGFLTQVYLGGREPFIELEQLSPLFAAGQAARFEILLSVNGG